jgi:UDP-glucuronate 4-epimerase
MANWSGRRVLVTGAAGFIGSHVAERLVSLGAKVIGLDNFDPFYDRAMKEANARVCTEASERGNGSFELLEGDLTDASMVRRAMDGCASVIHLAAKAGVRPSIEDPSGYALSNVVGTAVVLAEATRAGVDRAVVASSSSVYGNGSVVPYREDDAASEPISPYAATKRACELLGHTHHHLTGLPVGLLRFFTVYGPRQRPDLGIRLFLDRCARGQTIRMFGDGSTSRDYTFVDDIVDGVLAAHEAIPAHGFRVWNLGGSSPVRLDALIEAVEQTVGRSAVIERVDRQPGDVEQTWADLTRSSEELGYSPGVGLEEGLSRQWAWMQTL